jgi:hypothetical protein
MSRNSSAAATEAQPASSTQLLHQSTPITLFTVHELAQWLREHPGPDEKPKGAAYLNALGWLLTPNASYPGGHPCWSARKGYHVESTHGCSFDLDGPAGHDIAATLERVRLAGHAAVFWYTHSSTPAKPSGRLLVLHETCPADQHPAVYETLRLQLCPLAPSAQHNPNRGWNLPRACVEIQIVCDDPPVNWAALDLVELAARDRTPAPLPEPSATQGTEHDSRIVEHLATVWQHDTSGHYSWGAFGGVMCRIGVSEERAAWIAEELADKVVTAHENPVGRTLEAYEGYHDLGWPKLKEQLQKNGAGVPDDPPSEMQAYSEMPPLTASQKIEVVLGIVETLLRMSVAPPVPPSNDTEAATPDIESTIDGSDIRSLVSRRRKTTDVETNTILKRVADGHPIDARGLPAVIEAMCKGFSSFTDVSIAGSLLASASHAGVREPQLVRMVADHRAKQRALASVEAPAVTTVGVLTRLHDFVSKAGGLRFNEMTGVVERNGEPWTDEHVSTLRILCEQHGVSDPEKPIAVDNVERAVRIVARKNAYHPVKDYLESLPPWDDVPRLDSLFPGYMRCEESELNRALGACFAIAAVARLYEPGCKHDFMPIILGEQGCRKSSAIKALVGGEPAYSDAKLNLEHRSDAYLTLHECWVYECAELHAFAKSDQNVIKNMITQTTDRYLPPYGHNRVTAPRSSVMIGTTNQDDCLKDPTGSRRHPVVRCLATKAEPIDTDAIKRDRDLMWAEALHRYEAGEQWHLSPELEAALEISNEQHEASDTWQDQVEAWLRNPTRRSELMHGAAEAWESDTVSIGELLEHAIGIPVSRQEKPLQTRIGIVATRLRLQKAPNPSRRGSAHYYVGLWVGPLRQNGTW